MNTQRNLPLLPKYQNQLGVLDFNPEAHSINFFIEGIQQKWKKKFSMRKNKIQSSSLHKNNYNKWYINAELRYKKQQEDPRKQLITLQKQDYLYKNLHNKQFWDWVHPLQGSARTKKITDKINEKIDIKPLKDFKKYIESSPQKRLPLIVKSILQQKL